MSNIKYALLENIDEQLNAHAQGLKRVFINAEESGSSLTQFAYGSMSYMQESGTHFHKTMDEYFYFIKGTGCYVIDQQSIDIKPTTFIKIPAGTPHNLINTQKEMLEFVYFGIATI